MDTISTETGIFVTCSDPAIKEFIVSLDKKHHFIIQDIDSTHLFVKEQVCCGLAVVVVASLMFYFLYWRPKTRRSRPILDFTSGALTRELYEPLSGENDSEAAWKNARFFLRSNFEYKFVGEDQVPLIGARPEKAYFIVQSNSDPLYMSLLTIDMDKCPAPLFFEEGKAKLKKLLISLDHPFILPTIDLDTFAEKRQVAVFRRFCPQGSLEDVIQGHKPTYSQRKKSRKRKKKGNIIPDSRLWLYSRQILEGLLFLEAKGIPFTQLKAGNVIVDKGVCRLTDYENDLWGLSSLMTNEPVDIIQSFAYLFTYMATGIELDGPLKLPLGKADVNGSVVNVKLPCSRDAAELINTMFFEPEGITLKGLLKNRLIASVVLSANVSHKNTIIDSRLKKLLKQIKSNTALDRFNEKEKRKGAALHTGAGSRLSTKKRSSRKIEKEEVRPVKAVAKVEQTPADMEEGTAKPDIPQPAPTVSGDSLMSTLQMAIERRSRSMKGEAISGASVDSIRRSSTLDNPPSAPGPPPPPMRSKTDGAKKKATIKLGGGSAKAGRKDLLSSISSFRKNKLKSADTR